MKKICRFILCTWLLIHAIDTTAQNNGLYVVDLFNKTVDSLAPVAVPPVSSAKTSHSIGSFNNSILTLPLTLPDTNRCNTSPYTKKTLATSVGAISSYPARAVVVFGSYQNDTLNAGGCTGIMVGDRWVLTGAHCRDYGHPPVLRNDRTYDSQYIVPAYTNGTTIQGLDPVRCKKVYYPKKYNGLRSDLLLIELEQPLGNLTGWVSLGFANDEQFLGSKVLQKFSTPGGAVGGFAVYNGDTMYHSYGKPNVFENTYGAFDFAPPLIGFSGYSIECGVGYGESGSSLFYTNNVDSFITYGTLITAASLFHARINAENYFAFEKVMNNVVTNVTDVQTEKLQLYPNPAKNSVYINPGTNRTINELVIIGIDGRTALTAKNITAGFINIAALPPGVYIVQLRTKKELISNKLIKL